MFDRVKDNFCCLISDLDATLQLKGTFYWKFHPSNLNLSSFFSTIHSEVKNLFEGFSVQNPENVNTVF